MTDDKPLHFGEHCIDVTQENLNTMVVIIGASALRAAHRDQHQQQDDQQRSNPAHSAQIT
jgi:hypothetical protein